MTDLLHDERIARIAGEDVEAMLVSWPEVQSMARELLEYRERLAMMRKISGLDKVDQ